MCIGGFLCVFVLLRQKWSCGYLKSVAQHSQLFWQNEPKNLSTLVENYLEKTKLNVIEWPALRPDLNPIAKMWSDFTKNVLARRPPNLEENVLGFLLGSADLSSKNDTQMIIRIWDLIILIVLVFWVIFSFLCAKWNNVNIQNKTRMSTKAVVIDVLLESKALGKYFLKQWHFCKGVQFCPQLQAWIRLCGDVMLALTHRQLHKHKPATLYNNLAVAT